MKFMVQVLLAAVLALSGIVSYQFEQISNSRAEARARSLSTWHQVICSIERATLASPHVHPARQRAVVTFYDHLLVSIHARPCGLKIPKK